MTDDAINPSDDDDLPKARSWLFPAAAILIVLGFGAALFFILRSPSSQANGPEGVPLQNVPDLASPNTMIKGSPVNGITCRSSMGQTVAFHVHVHVSIFVNGQQKRIPAGVGITPPRFVQKVDGATFLNNSAKSCVYWLHTHANDGIIHIESPVQRTFTLGDFFAIWNQPLSHNQVGPAKGKVVAVVNGTQVETSPANIKLTGGSVIQLSVGDPVVPFKPMKFAVKNICGDGTLSCSIKQPNE